MVIISQFLTPHKISLLILIENYCVIPWGRQTTEDLLFILINHVSGTQADDSSHLEPTLKELCHEIRLLGSEHQRGLKDILLSHLESFETPDAFYNFFNGKSSHSFH